MIPQVTIIRTGVANTASVVAAFKRLGAEVRLTDDADDVRSAAARRAAGRRASARPCRHCEARLR